MTTSKVISHTKGAEHMVKKHVAVLIVFLVASIAVADDIPLTNWTVTIEPPTKTSAGPRGGLRIQSDVLNVNSSFIPIAPCRLVDTRNPDGLFGGPKFI